MSTSTQPKRWFYSSSGQQIGPVSARQLKSLADSHQLQPTDLIWSEGMPDWRLASDTKGLFGAAMPKPTAPPIPPPLPPTKDIEPELAKVRTKSASSLSLLRARSTISYRIAPHDTR